MKYLVGFLMWCAGMFVIFAPIINHVVWCIGEADRTGSAIALLIVGLVITPISWIHGVCLWLGFTWI